MSVGAKCLPSGGPGPFRRPLHCTGMRSGSSVNFTLAFCPASSYILAHEEIVSSRDTNRIGLWKSTTYI